MVPGCSLVGAPARAFGKELEYSGEQRRESGTSPPGVGEWWYRGDAMMLHGAAFVRPRIAHGEAPPPARAPSAAQRNAARQAERRLVVYLEEPQRRWLRGIEAD